MARSSMTRTATVELGPRAAARPSPFIAFLESASPATPKDQIPPMSGRGDLVDEARGINAFHAVVGNPSALEVLRSALAFMDHVSRAFFLVYIGGDKD